VPSNLLASDPTEHYRLSSFETSNWQRGWPRSTIALILRVCDSARFNKGLVTLLTSRTESAALFLSNKLVDKFFIKMTYEFFYRFKSRKSSALTFYWVDAFNNINTASVG